MQHLLITGNDRHPFPASIRTQRAILAKLRPKLLVLGEVARESGMMLLANPI
jgi:hypothetical protein